MHNDAPLEIIKSSYRTLMQKLNAHPDRGGDVAEAALINKAYAVLSDPEKREAYDLALAAQTEVVVAEGQQSLAQTVRIEVGAVCPFCLNRHPYRGIIPSGVVCTTCDSPLTFAGKNLSDRSGQREIWRIEKRTKLSFYTQADPARSVTATTLDISPRGLMFEAPVKILVDSIFKIDCSRFKAIAQVVTCRKTGTFVKPNWHIGVRFVTLNFNSSRGTFVIDSA